MESFEYLFLFSDSILELILCILGILIVTVVPLFSSLATSILPLCRSTIAYTTESPKPVPVLESTPFLVVKNGSNIFDIYSLVVPQPVSVSIPRI